MKLDEINALKSFNYDELIDRLHKDGGSYTALVKKTEGLPTKDTLRLAIIDRAIAAELGEDPDPPPPADPGKATN